MDKRLIAAHFARARKTYRRQARVQQQVAEKMILLLTNKVEKETSFRHILEIGCGIGGYSRLLFQTFCPETFLLNDLCSEMEECVGDLLRKSTSVQFLSGDAEIINFPRNRELITSCSTLQWFSRPDRFFGRCHHLLAENGILAFSTFGPENMKEIKEVTGHSLPYLSLTQLTVLLAKQFELLYTEEEMLSISFHSPMEVLRHLRETGVTGTEKGMWTRGKLETFCNEYIRLFENEEGHVKLTYHPIYVIARKRKNI